MTTFPELFEQDLQISQVSVTDEITLTLHATSPTAACPDCGTISTRLHSHYRRTVHDLPNRRRPVHLVLQIRRFRCQKSTCARKIFAERFPALARPYAQRTLQLQEALRHVGIALGGQAGTRLGSELGISGSRDTTLRLVRAVQLPALGSPKKVGIDDWAWKRGHRYGTLVCDLERGIPIDLLPDRSVETVTAWFQRHPGVELISRDRASEYAVAASKGAPQAVQVADRWHVMKNLREALEVLVARHLTTHQKKKTHAMTTQREAVILEKQPTRSSHQVHIQRLHREERLAKYEQVLALLKQGMTRRAIADQVGVGLTTIQNWRLAGSFPERKPREQASQLDPYRPYVEKRWLQGYHNLMGIYRELQARGYRGSYENIRAQFIITSPKHRSKQAGQSSRERAFPAKRLAAFLFLRRPEDLTAEEQEAVRRLRQLDPEIDLAYLFAQQFAQMIRTRTGEKLDAWLLAVRESSLVDLYPFVNSISEDKAAVLAGLTREESNGQTEGQITRLKLIKRSMYGRAKFDLLRIRVLSSPQKDLRTRETTRSSPSWRAGEEKTVNSQRTTFGVMGVA
jgi:transposase